MASKNHSAARLALAAFCALLGGATALAGNAMAEKPNRMFTDDEMKKPLPLESPGHSADQSSLAVDPILALDDESDSGQPKMLLKRKSHSADQNSLAVDPVQGMDEESDSGQPKMPPKRKVPEHKMSGKPKGEM